jgi:hypothetical protein
MGTAGGAGGRAGNGGGVGWPTPGPCFKHINDG